MRTRPGRLLLSKTTIMSYFGLEPSAYAEEVSSLGGPSQKTILRIMRGKTKSFRPATQERLDRAIRNFELKKIPGILGSGEPRKSNDRQDREVAKLGKRLMELIESSQEAHILDIIENHCGYRNGTSTHKRLESEIVLYNLCVWHGYEYILHYPNDIDMLVLFSPRELGEKTALPLRLWARQHILASVNLFPSSRSKNFSQLATELGISKQALNRYIDAKKTEHLPRFKTLVLWCEMLEDSSGSLPLAELSKISLLMAMSLHSFYIDILENTSLSEKEILELFGLSSELRALWPSVLLR